MGQLCRDPLPTPDVASGVNRMGVFAGLVAGVTYSTCASFVANALTPVSGRLVEVNSFRRAVSGQGEHLGRGVQHRDPLVVAPEERPGPAEMQHGGRRRNEIFERFERAHRRNEQRLGFRNPALIHPELAEVRVPPDEVVFISWFEGGDVFRSGCTWKRGNGKIFYFAPGHEAYPIYFNPNVQLVLRNAVRWATPDTEQWIDTCPQIPISEACEPLEQKGPRMHEEGEEGYR